MPSRVRRGVGPSLIRLAFFSVSTLIILRLLLLPVLATPSNNGPRRRGNGQLSASRVKADVVRTLSRSRRSSVDSRGGLCSVQSSVELRMTAGGGGLGGGVSGLEIRPKIDVLEEMELPVSPGRDRSADIEKGRVGRKKRKRSAAFQGKR